MACVLGPVVWTISTAPGFSVLSKAGVGAPAFEDVCGKVSGNASGVPPSEKKLMCIWAEVVPLFTMVNVVVQKPAEAICASEPELVKLPPTPDPTVSVTFTVC